MPHGPAVKATSALQNASNVTQGGRRRGRPKLLPDAAQREQVVAAAHHLFVAEGYGGTTMDALAAHCHMSKRTLYRLFPGKAELFAAVVEAHRQSMLALPLADERMPLDAALAAIFRIDISEDEDRARHALLHLVMVERHAFPELKPILIHHGPERSQADLADWLAARAARGEITLDDPAAMARLLMDMVFGGLRPKHPGAPGAGAQRAEPGEPGQEGARRQGAPQAGKGQDGPSQDGSRPVLPPLPDPEARRAHIRRCIGVFLNGVVPR